MRVQTKPVFQYELSFAMTIHKSQGRTIKKVVLVLSKHAMHAISMKYQSIFVTLSRVKKPYDLRILIHSSGENKGIQGLSYITKLNPDRIVMEYYAGFHNQCGMWNENMSLEKRLPSMKENPNKKAKMTTSNSKINNPTIVTPSPNQTKKMNQNRKNITDHQKSIKSSIHAKKLKLTMVRSWVMTAGN